MIPMTTEPATPYIIVYGTLRRNGWNHGLMRELEGHVDYITDVTLPYTMFYLGVGEIPGVDIYTPGTMEAELYSINDPSVVGRLDMLEGHDESYPEASLYRREVVPVEVGGQNVEAYIYHFNRQRRHQAEVITKWQPKQSA